MIKKIIIFLITSLLIITMSSCASTDNSSNIETTVKPIINETNINEKKEKQDTKKEQPLPEKTVISNDDINADIYVNNNITNNAATSNDVINEKKEVQKETGNQKVINNKEINNTDNNNIKKVQDKPVKENTNSNKTVKPEEKKDRADSSKETKQQNTADIIEEEKKETTSKNTIKITRYENSMFWKLEGTDKYGKPSLLYVLGTIHAGDNKLYPIPDIIEEAFNKADRIVGELSAEAWKKLPEATNKRLAESEKKEADRIKEGGVKLSQSLTKEQYKYLSTVIKNKEKIDMFEPWVFISELSEIPLILSGLDSTKSYDIYFLQKSLEGDIKLEGLDTIDTQLNALEYGDWNTQLLMLQDTIDSLITDSQEAAQYTLDTYEAYISADEIKLAEIINSNMKTDSKSYSEDYYNKIFIERNKNWANHFTNFLLEGGTTFVFAGCGHLVGEDSVFNFMEENNIIVY